MPRGRHIYAKASDMAKATMYSYPWYYHALPYCKFLFWCCSKCPFINIPDQEIDNHYSDTTPPMMFHNYHIIAHYTANGRIPLKDKKICRMCKK